MANLSFQAMLLCWRKQLYKLLCIVAIISSRLLLLRVGLSAAEEYFKYGRNYAILLEIVLQKNPLVELACVGDPCGMILSHGRTDKLITNSLYFGHAIQ